MNQGPPAKLKTFLSSSLPSWEVKGAARKEKSNLFTGAWANSRLSSASKFFLFNKTQQRRLSGGSLCFIQYFRVNVLTTYFFSHLYYYNVFVPVRLSEKQAEKN